MRYSNPILAVSLLLALTSGVRAMTTYTEQWMSGDTVYATASTDSDFEPEVASATLVIYGPSGTSASVGWGDWYYACAQTSLQLTTEGEHYAYSTHYTQSIPAIAIWRSFKALTGIRTNYQFSHKYGGNTCVFTESCPAAGGGPTRLCPGESATQFVSVSPPVYQRCGDDINYYHLKHWIAVKFDFNPVWRCFLKDFPYTIASTSTWSDQPTQCTQEQ